MSKTDGSNTVMPAGLRRLGYRVLLLLSAGCIPHTSLQAQPLMPGASPWSGFGAPMNDPAFPSMPSAFGGTPTMPREFTRSFPDSPYDAWPGRRATSADRYSYRNPTDSYQPDLTGSWRGSGGETVEIQRNRARIWGGSDSHQSCSCVFFSVGQRLIAYSPDTDRVRKYWFKQVSGDRFALIDDSGNLMSFWRVR